MKTISKFQCEYCGLIFDTENGVLAHEEEHKKLQDVPVKEIYYNAGMNSFTIYNYPHAKFNKKDNTYKLTKHRDFCYESRFQFDKIQHVENEYNDVTNDLVIYTLNFDEKYEEELINKMIEFRKNELLNKLTELESLKTNLNQYISRIEDYIW